LLESGQVGLGREVVMVIDKSFAKQFEDCADGEQRVGRIRRVNDVEAVSKSNPTRENEHRERGIAELENVTDEAVAARRRRKTKDLDAVNIFRPCLTLASRGNNENPKACVAKRQGLPAYSNIEGVRIVLYEH
jgi:hypothetical protein